MFRQVPVLEVGESGAVPVGHVDDQCSALSRSFEKLKAVGRDGWSIGIEMLSIGMEKRILHVDDDERRLHAARAPARLFLHPNQQRASMTIR